MNPKTIKNTVVVRPDMESIEKIKHGTLELFSAIWYQGEAVYITTGIVESLPQYISKDTFGYDYDCDMELRPGDKVWFGYLEVCDANKIDDGVYAFHFDKIYTYSRDNVLHMMPNYLLLEASEAATETKSGIIIADTIKIDTQKAKVVLKGSPRNSDKALYENIKEGSTIIHESKMNVPLRIEGKNYHWLKMKYAIAVVNDPPNENKYTLLADWAQVKRSEPYKQTLCGIFIPETAQKATREGIVLDYGPDCKETEAGVRVVFDKNWLAEIPTEDGTDCFVREEFILLRYGQN